MKNTIIFDTETTGLTDPDVIEVGYLSVYLDGGLKDHDDGFEQRYKPNKPIELGALATHHILPEWLDDCPPTGSFRLPEGTEYIIGHNIDFDWRALGEPDVKRICTQALATKYYQDVGSFSQVALTYHFTQDKAAARRRVMEAHNALLDVYMCFDLLRNMMSDRIPSVSTMEDLWLLSQAARIPEIMAFGKYKGQRFDEIPTDYCRWILRQDDMDQYVKQAARQRLGVTE